MPPRCAFARRATAVARRLAGCREGAAAVEFAIAAPVLMLIMFGSIEIGRMLYADHAIGHAARESTRFAMVRSADSEAPATTAQIHAIARRATVLDPDSVGVDVAYDPDATRGSAVTVRVRYRFRPMLPYVASGAITLEAHSTKLLVN